MSENENEQVEAEAAAVEVAAPETTDARNRRKARVGVVVSDSVGRAWRIGTTGLALGLAGIPLAVLAWIRRGGTGQL